MNPRFNGNDLKWLDEELAKTLDDKQPHPDCYLVFIRVMAEIRRLQEVETKYKALVKEHSLCPKNTDTPT